MEYHTATTAASVVVHTPVKIVPRIMTKVSSAGIDAGMVFNACSLDTGEQGIFLPFSVKCVTRNTWRHREPHRRIPGIIPPKNMLATDIWEIAPRSTIAALGGIIGPMMDEAAVTPAEYAGS